MSDTVYVVSSEGNTNGFVYFGTTSNVDDQIEDVLTSVSSGQTVYVRCEPYSGYKFKQWGVRSGSYTNLTGTTNATGGSLVVTGNVVIYAEFIETQKWTVDGDYWKYANTDAEEECIAPTEYILVNEGYTGELIIESSTEFGQDGIIFATKNLSSFLNRTLASTIFTGEGYSSLYATDSYATGYEGDGNNKWSKTISNIPAANYFINAYWDSLDTEGENWVRYKFTETPIEYTVVFHSNGGSFSDDWGEGSDDVRSKKVVYNTDTLKKVYTAQKVGAGFAGWYTDASSGVQVYNAEGNFNQGSHFNAAGNWIYTKSTTVNLYAHYGDIQYYVKYDPNNDVYSGYMPDSTFTYGETGHLSKNEYTREYCVFLGWAVSPDAYWTYPDKGVIYNLSSTDGDTITLYAKWKDYLEEEEKEAELVTDYNKMSAGSIKTLIDNNDVNYVKDDNEETYKVKMLNPDSVNTLDIFTVSPVIESNKNIVGSMDITLKEDVNDLNLKIINRYSGYYNPIFKDILFFNDYSDDEKTYSFSHTSFDSDYKDSQGEFGVIKNMWFHKVNDEDNTILGTRELKYPMTGEYALDFRDYNIFSTSWDKGYFTKQTDIKNKESQDNTESMKEGLCMFGSKYLNVPEYITLECFDNDDFDGEWKDEWITNTEGCPGEVMFKEVNDNSVNYYFFIRKRLKRFFREQLKDEFTKYINPKYSFGKIDTIDDDIDEYVEKNVLKLYELKKIRTFVKRTKRGVPDIKIENEYDGNLDKTVTELKTAGFKEITNVSMTKKNTDDFDRQLTYNLRTGEQEDFGFQVVIKKI